jgi:hypothetical protein
MKPALQVRLFGPRSVEKPGDAGAVPTGTTDL